MNTEDKEEYVRQLVKWHLNKILQDTRLLLQYVHVFAYPGIKPAIEDILNDLKELNKAKESKANENNKEEMATEAQKRFLAELKRRVGEEVDMDWLNSLTKKEASREINRLLRKTGG